jgi:hypothetical protein
MEVDLDGRRMRPVFGLRFLLPLVAAAPAAAQQPCASAVDSTAAPAVRIHARALVGELRFTSEPRADVAVGGCPAANAIDVIIRDNLPRPVQAGTTYRDVAIGIEIRTSLSVLCASALKSLLSEASTPAAARMARLCGDTSPPDTTGQRSP